MDVEPGLYVVRYVSCVPPDTQVHAVLRPVPGYESCLDIVGAPGQRPGVLEFPGHSVALVVRQPGSVEVSLQRGRADAKLSFELLTRAAASAAERRLGYRDRRDGPAGCDRLEVLGHVYRLGDVVAGDGEWLGGPDVPAPIEGLAFRIPGGRVGIAIQYRNTLLHGHWSEWIGPECFAGTRRCGSALTALRLRLEGPDANLFTLEIEAMFLGASPVKRRGRMIEVASPSFDDSLIGFRLALKASSAISGEPPTPHVTDLTSSRSRVRVYRSHDASRVCEKLG